MIENFLYKDRSYSSCIHSAYELMFNNFATIFRRTWLAALVCSAVISVSVFFDALPWMQLVLLIPSIFAVSWLGTSVMSLLNEESRKRNYIYCLQAVLSMTILAFIFAVIMIVAGTVILLLLGNGKSPDHIDTVYAVCMGVLTVLVIVAAIPLNYSVMKYLFESKSRIWSVFGAAYRNGWRYWGFIALVLVLCAIIVAVLYVVIGMPRSVMYIAFQNNAYGLTIGDPNGLPEYFNILDYIVSVVVYFIALYISMWIFFVMYYVYGRIEVRIRTKQNNIELNETAKTLVHRS